MNLPLLPVRRPDSHKGDYGRCLLIGGSRGMTGAITLAGVAALRSGAGLVQLAVPDTCQPIVAGYEPSCMTLALPSDEQGQIAHPAQSTLGPRLAWATVAAIGPGLGRSPDLDALVRWLYTTVAAPLVVDADALNALADQQELLVAAPGPRILTPHPGEFQRLVAAAGPFARAAAEPRARELAARVGGVVVLKGHRTYITDGSRAATNGTGNPGLATGGTGDVLTGVIAALLGQGLSPFDAAVLGAHVHGLAGDIAVAELGQVSLMASDLPRYLPAAFRTLTQ